MAGGLYFDGVDISAAHNIWISGEPPDWLSTPPTSLQVARLSGRSGAIVSTELEVGERTLNIPIRILGTTPTVRRTNEQWLKAQVGAEVLVRIDGNDGAVRQIRGVLEAVPLNPLKRVVTQTSYGSIRVVCGDPFFQEVSSTDLALTTAEVAIGLGTAPVRHWSLAVTGAITDLTATIRAGLAGPTLATLVRLGSQTTETLTIDSANGLVMLDATNVFASYSGGFPEFRPRQVPTIQLSAAAGTPAGVLSLRKRDW
jgi:hypothetical protein